MARKGGALMESPHRGRHKFLVDVPKDEISSSEFIAIVSDTLQVNAELLGIESHKDGWADNWSNIILRAVRYGVPTADFGAEGFRIAEDYTDDLPTCESCQ